MSARPAGHEEAPSDPRSPVERTLSRADEAATRGDYMDALAWLKTVEAVGSQVPPEYEARRAAWLDALDSEGSRD